MTYNKYLTKGLEDGSIEVMVIEGVRIARVRRPKEGEEVVGFTNFSDCLYTQFTLTEVARRDARLLQPEGNDDGNNNEKGETNG